MATSVQAESRCEGDLAPQIRALRPTRRATAQRAKVWMPNLGRAAALRWNGVDGDRARPTGTLRRPCGAGERSEAHG